MSEQTKQKKESKKEMTPMQLVIKVIIILLAIVTWPVSVPCWLAWKLYKNEMGLLKKLALFILFIFFWLPFTFAVFDSSGSTSTNSQEINTVTEEIVLAPEEMKDRLSTQIEELPSIDFASLVSDSATDYMVAVGWFGGVKMLIDQAYEYNDPDIDVLAKQLESILINTQIHEFPKLRKAYADYVDTLMWEHNIDAFAKGEAYGTLELVGATFANNANIKTFQLELQDMLKLLRFDRVNYKWYEYDSDYTYFTIDSLLDSEPTVYEE